MRHLTLRNRHPMRRTDRRPGDRGQMIVVFAISLSVALLLAGLSVDGAYALSQRRSAQNAADFAALAGARIIMKKMAGDAAGTDANVKSAIDAALAQNGAQPITYGAPSGPTYLSATGTVLGYVNAGSIPSGAVGVVLGARMSWRPFLLGILGVTSWSASASASARGTTSGTGPGILFPAAIYTGTLDDLTVCPSTSLATDCNPSDLTGGNTPSGGFGWLKFGCTRDGGQDGSCGNSLPYLQDQLDPPGNSHGCCTAVPAGGYIQVGSMTGNKVAGDGSYWVNNRIIVLMPVYSASSGNGSNGIYRITGFVPVELTQVFGASNIRGVIRGSVVTDPANATGSAVYTVQLVR